ncbi:MAG: hypothetical protein GY811_06805 [Myxococcales bacterium]|nr:hypothetical protein [Myxococcales bacterium]
MRRHNEDLGPAGRLHSYRISGITPDVHIAWLDDATFLAGTAHPEPMRRVLSAENPAVAQQRFADFAKPIDTRAMVCGVSLNDKQPSDANRWSEAFRLHIDFKDGLQMHMTMRFYDEQSAAEARNGWASAPIPGSLGSLMTQSMKVTGSGKDAIANLTLASPQVAELIAAVDEAWPAIEQLYRSQFPDGTDTLPVDSVSEKDADVESPTPEQCRGALENVQRLTGIKSNIDLDTVVSSCISHSTKRATVCIAAAKTNEKLDRRA